MDPQPGPAGVDGAGLGAAVALLTATLPGIGSSPQARDDALRAIPTSCEEALDLLSGVYVVAHVLLLELAELTGDPLDAPLRRLTVAPPGPARSA